MLFNQTLIIFGDGDMICQNVWCNSEEMPYVLTIHNEDHGLEPGTVEEVDPREDRMATADVVIGFESPEMIDHLIDQLYDLRLNLVIEKLHTSKED